MFSFFSGSQHSNDQPDEQSNDANQRPLTAEEIREQRARKLQSNNQPDSPSTNQSNNQTSPSTPVQPATRPQTSQSTTQSTNSPRQPIQTSAIKPPSNQSSPTSNSPITPLRTSQTMPSALNQSVNQILNMYQNLPASLRPSPTPSSNQSPEQWVSEMICEVLLISVDKQQSTSQPMSYSKRRTFLAETAREVAEQSTNQSTNQSSDRLMTLDLLDQALIERLMLPFDRSASCSVVWLIACYKRAYDILSILSQLSNQVPAMIAQSTQPIDPAMFPSTSAHFEQSIKAVQTLIERIVSYCLIVLTDEEMTTDPDPSMQPANQPISVKALNARELLKMLMSDSYLSRPLPPQFLESLINQASNQLSEIFTPIISMCGPMLDRWQQSVASSPFDLSKKKLQALTVLSKFPSLATIICQHRQFFPPPPAALPSWQMMMQQAPASQHNGWTFQTQSLLGYHMSHALAPNDPTFANIRGKTRGELDSDMVRLRGEYDEYIQLIAELLKGLIRDKACREKVCMFFTTLANINSIHIKRRQHGYDDPTSRSSDGLIFTSLRVLLILAQPIQKKKPGDQVQEPKFFELVKLEYALNKDPTRYINYEKSSRLAASTPETTAKAAEIDPANLTNFNFGTEVFFIAHEFIQLISPILREYIKLMQAVGQTQRAIQRGQGSEEEFGLLFSQMCSRDVQLQDPGWHNEMCSFYEYSSGLFVSHLLKGANQTLIKYLPETIIESELDYLVWSGQVVQKFFGGAELSFVQISTLLVTCAHGEHAIKNPHTRAKISGVVLALFIPHGKQDAHLSHVLDGPVFRAQLMPALIDLYVEIEFGAGMYYQKFNVRYELTLALQHLWTLDHYKQQLITMSRDLTHFLLFMNALANDLVYLLDEALKLLGQIRQYQQTENDPRPGETPEQQREREEAHHQSEQQCTSMMQLASSTIAFVSSLTESIVEPFVTPQLDFCSRFATTLMYYINKLVGPSIANLNVQNKEKYHFAPRDLLQQIMQIFLHLSSSSLFIEKVAADERSYSPDIMNRAYSIISRRGILEERDKRQFAKVIRDIAQAHAVAQDWEANIGDVPEQYGDALLSTLMSDPVMLPTSKMIVDRVTIQRHLLNSKTDPFNRSPLTEAELIEQPELKAEIEQWIATKKAEYKARLAEQQGEADIEMNDDTANDGKDAMEQ